MGLLAGRFVDIGKVIEAGVVTLSPRPSAENTGTWDFMTEIRNGFGTVVSVSAVKTPCPSDDPGDDCGRVNGSIKLSEDEIGNINSMMTSLSKGKNTPFDAASACVSRVALAISFKDGSFNNGEIQLWFGKHYGYEIFLFPRNRAKGQKER